MERTAADALNHLQHMETRIERQMALIAQLRQSGQDTMEAVRKLALLEHALEEMRLLMGHLLPSEVRERLKAAS